MGGKGGNPRGAWKCHSRGLHGSATREETRKKTREEENSSGHSKPSEERGAILWIGWYGKSENFSGSPK